ncbi:alkaline phosphatase PhoX [Cyanobium gracile UHCC 0139]|uniref:Alkaline phosphatase PhoX n=1 Tax=Cyanobium gracile UHCC 0139 TaxID=3110308 RepID=A0ABU5RSN5_9CYAN|nr:alkaline phosphatase PhoX [Cyanobium gracile]MEA5390797.1 alkaline phosphatase PhoX [Cyanobium gracile UHCC 0139]
MNRRDLLSLLGIGACSFAGAALPTAAPGRAAVPRAGAARTPPPPFPTVPTPLPVPSDGFDAAEQRHRYARIELEDRLVLPDGFRADLVAVWGDPVADGRFGFNNDHLSFLSLGADRALLTVNFEYISARAWRQGYAEAVGGPLPFDAVIDALAPRGGRVDAASLAADDPLRATIRQLAEAAMADLGVGVIELERQPDGPWRRRPGRFDRRITGLSGWRDPAQRLGTTGPAAAVFRRRERLGYDDGLGDAIIGSFANCAGGETPWGTVLSAEENMQSQVAEAVHADGSSVSPAARPFAYDGQRLDGLGNPFGLAGNKYGWMVELDPRRPERTAVKHSWLGRFRHEAVAVKAVAGQPLVVYSGCDRHGGHLYRFVSDALIRDPADPANSELFSAGRLEVARFDPPGPDGGEGRGRWLPLEPTAPVAPLGPGHFARFGVEQAVLLPHSDRLKPGAEAFASDAAVAAYRRLFATLADLYPGEGEERMGAILIDAHLAACAIGATPCARPEDTVIDPLSGDLLIAFTAGGGSDDGRADPAIFRGPKGQATWPYGWIMGLADDGAEKAGAFRWRMVATGGAPWQGGLGFANPDNLAVDRLGTLWMVTDRSTKSADLDLFGNNSCWVLPSRGPHAGEAFCFATGPMECELTGPCFDASESTLFLAVQHPGEDHGTRPSAEAREAQAHRLVDRSGRAFEQLRWVPQGSNWPSGVPGRAPRPGVVAIRRLAGGPLLGPQAVPASRERSI